MLFSLLDVISIFTETDREELSKEFEISHSTVY